MSTTLYVNSLIRYKESDKCNQKEPSPFDFTVPTSETNKWRWKLTPHAQQAYRDTGGFETELDALIIPAALMDKPDSFVMYELNCSGLGIDVGNMTRVKANNDLCQQIFGNCNCTVGLTGCCFVQGCTGVPGCTGVTGARLWQPCENSKKDNAKNTWIAHYERELRDSNGNIIYYLYKSNCIVSLPYQVFAGSLLNIKILDSTGVLLQVPGLDCSNPCNYAKLFCKEYQVNATFIARFVPVKTITNCY